MEKINRTLQRLASNESFQKRYEEQRQQLLNHPDILNFITEHQDKLDKEIIDKSMTKLYEYTQQSKECNSCESLDGCINFMKGYHPNLVLVRNSIDLVYKRCPRKVLP